MLQGDNVRLGVQRMKVSVSTHPLFPLLSSFESRASFLLRGWGLWFKEHGIPRTWQDAQLSSSSPTTHLSRLLRQDSQGVEFALTAESESVESLLFILFRDTSLIGWRLEKSWEGLGAMAMRAVLGTVPRLDMTENIRRVTHNAAICSFEVGLAVSLTGPV